MDGFEALATQGKARVMAACASLGPPHGHRVLGGAMYLLVIGLVAVITLREVPLRTQSGIDARRSEDADAARMPGPSATPVVLPAEAAVSNDMPASDRP